MKSTYVMTEAQVEALAAERTQSLTVVEGFDSTYLRVLITAVQAKLGPKRGKRPDTNAQLDALESIAVPFYGAVLRGVITSDIALDASLDPAEATKRTRERNRRATFARTAKSTLVSWVTEGGDLRALSVATVTKSELRAAVTAAKAEHGTPAASRIERAQNAILSAVAKETPEVARERLESVIAALQEALDELPDQEAHHDTTSIRTRAGTPTFREPRILNRGSGAAA